MPNYKLDKIVVVDIEWTCWENNIWEIGGPELIEIGACLIDNLNNSIIKTSNYMVRPKYKISDYCYNLTKISQEMANKGIPFRDACNKLVKDFGTHSKIWVGWGNEKTSITKECLRLKSNYPFGDQYINLQLIFSLKNDIKSKVNLVDALKYYGLDFEGQLHRAKDDAYNTSRLYFKIIKETK